jgi:pimeloyl-ACP methyl ester carboxylesterase
MAGETRMATTSDGAQVAYQVIGSGPIDLVWVPGFFSHLDLAWADVAFGRFVRGLARFSRFITYDRRGCGLSGPLVSPPAPEDRIDDLRAVLDAAGSERAVIVGFSEGAGVAVLFAATYPQRVSGLVLHSTAICGWQDEDHPYGLPDEVWVHLDTAIENWGSGRSLDLLWNSLANDMRRKTWGYVERLSASKESMQAIMAANRTADVAPALRYITAPSLVIHRVGDFIPPDAGRHAAAEIPNAKYIELPGDDHLPWVSHAEEVVTAIRDFVSAAEPGDLPTRVRATVMYTDIVDSTAQLAELGDEVWAQRLELHYDGCRRQATSYGGFEINTTGDGMVWVFDSPVQAGRAAIGIMAELADIGLAVRVGVHCGELDLRSIGAQGMTMHFGARVQSAAEAGQVLFSEIAAALCSGTDLRFDDVGSYELKGVAGRHQLHSLRLTRVAEAKPVAPRTLLRRDRAFAGLAHTLAAINRRRLAQRT